MPMFAAMALLPAALNVVNPGRTLVTISDEPYLAVTDSGLWALLTLALRIGAALSFVTLLAMTTSSASLMAGFQSLGAPRAIIGIVTMTLRYVSLFAGVAAEAYTARKSRAVRTSRARTNRQFAGALVGSLAQKAQVMAEDAHDAMISRGWTGTCRTLDPPRVRLADLALVVAAVSLGALALTGGFRG
jgi:energy-coupling factor transporter transmembrane protein EcfT